MWNIYNEWFHEDFAKTTRTSAHTTTKWDSIESLDATINIIVSLTLTPHQSTMQPIFLHRSKSTRTMLVMAQVIASQHYPLSRLSCDPWTRFDPCTNLSTAHIPRRANSSAPAAGSMRENFYGLHSGAWLLGQYWGETWIHTHRAEIIL